MKIGEYLILHKKLTETQLKDALFIQSISEKRLGEILAEMGYISDLDIAVYLAYNSEREFFKDLRLLSIDRKENEKLGFSFLYEVPAVAAKKDGNPYLICSEVTAGLSEKMAFDENLKGFKIGFSTKSKIYKALNPIFINKAEFSEKEILDEAVEIALLKGSPNLRIKRSENFYIIIMDTDLRQENIRVLSMESGQRIINIIAGYCQATLKKGEGLDAKFIFVSNFYKGMKINIRVAFLPISSKLDKESTLFEAVLRIHGLNKVFDFKSIGFSDDKSALMEKSYILPHGLIIATGPTGSGKTTTFYTMLKLLSRKKSSIITIEDPVEIELRESNITQMNISDDFGYSDAVRVMLRSEPDIMMIGEVRDEITARYSLAAAETGHLVLTTLHANSALSIFYRFKSLDVDLMQLISVLRFVTAQRLYNPLCPICKKKISASKLPLIQRQTLSENFLRTADKQFSNLDSIYVRGEKECDNCGGCGYVKRKPIIEIAEFDYAVKEEIYRNLTLLSNIPALEGILTELSNFQSLKVQAFNKLADGEIDPITYFKLSR